MWTQGIQAVVSGATRPGEPGGHGAPRERPEPKWREVRVQKERTVLTLTLAATGLTSFLRKMATSCPNTTTPH